MTDIPEGIAAEIRSALNEGRAEDARRMLYRSDGLDEKKPDTDFLKGKLASLENREHDAARYYLKTLRQVPDHSPALNNLANYFQKKKHFKTALFFLQKAFYAWPEAKPPRVNLLSLLKKLNIRPSDYYFQAGYQAQKDADYKKALFYYSHAHRSNSTDGWVLYHSGICQMYGGNRERAVYLFEQALRRARNDKKLRRESLHNLVHFAEDKKSVSGYLDELSRTEPNSLYVRFLRERESRKYCDWDRYRENKNIFRSYIETLPMAGLAQNDDHLRLLSMSQNFMDSGYSQSLLNKLTACYANLLREQSGADPNSPPRGVAKRDGKKIRLAYVSPDLREHPVGRAFHSLPSAHDRERFDIYIYAVDNFPVNDDAYRESIKLGADVFRVFGEKNISELHRAVLFDKIDVLVDLAGFTKGNPCALFLKTPLPVTVHMLGFPSGLGGLADYFLADKYTVPDNEERLFSEKVIRLRAAFPASKPLPFANGENPAGTGKFRFPELDGLPENAFLFCALHRTAKIDPISFGRWTSILKRTENTYLSLPSPHPEIKGTLGEEAEKRGVAKERLLFFPKFDPEKYYCLLARHHLFLDSFCYAAATTAVDCLYSGLPVLTKTGNNIPSRQAASFVGSLELTELITDSADAFENKAVEFAENPGVLIGIRKRIKEAMPHSPSFNVNLYAKEFESFVLGLFRRDNPDSDRAR